VAEEKRKNPRLDCRFMISYGIAGQADKNDVSQLRNLSLGGVAFTSGHSFAAGSEIVLKLKLPNSPLPIMPSGKVLDSKELVKGLIYQNRIEFVSLKEEEEKALSEILQRQLKG
jgi:hypothetical protein